MILVDRSLCVALVLCLGFPTLKCHMRAWQELEDKLAQTQRGQQQLRQDLEASETKSRDRQLEDTEKKR